jgi:general nucleoside transport system permease protein
MHDSVLVATLAAAVVAGTPLVWACLGALANERAGVLNLGVEGMMLLGACTAFLASHASGSAVVGLLAGALGGTALAAVHAVSSISLRANQIVSGLALTIFGSGLARYLGKPVEGTTITGTIGDLPVPGLRSIPGVGPVLFDQDALVYLSWVACALAAFYLSRTRPGLSLRAVGDSPATADAMGIRVAAIRYAHTLAGGALCGIGGAYLVLRVVSTWNQEGTTGGQGWIALALVVFAGWRPLLVILGAYLFGLALRANFALQGEGVQIPAELLSMLPYVLTIAVLVVLSVTRRDGGAPQVLGRPFVRDER